MNPFYVCYPCFFSAFKRIQTGHKEVIHPQSKPIVRYFTIRVFNFFSFIQQIVYYARNTVIAVVAAVEAAVNSNEPNPFEPVGAV